MPALKTNRREFLQLADTYRPDKDHIAGWYMSEKLDGTRCWWDGGLTRGMLTEDVPWASLVNPKTGQRKAKIKPFSTGLWSRYGNPIMAPDWFLDSLPTCFLDGELWAGRGKFQLCRSICGGDTPDSRFDQIQYAVYSSPPMPAIFRSGEIKNANMHREISVQKMESFVLKRMKKLAMTYVEADAVFEEELGFLQSRLNNDNVFLHRQTRLPNDEASAASMMLEHLNNLLLLGAEGVIIRNPMSGWQPKRHRGLLKFKPFEDDEATITGFTSGRETNKGSRLLGKVGALITEYQGKRLELAGLTDEEREFATDEMARYAADHPGEDMPTSFQGRHFKAGQTVTFKYRELTDDGIPKEARLWRLRVEE